LSELDQLKLDYDKLKNDYRELEESYKKAQEDLRRLRQLEKRHEESSLKRKIEANSQAMTSKKLKASNEVDGKLLSTLSQGKHSRGLKYEESIQSSRFGHNNNPNSVQLEHALKGMLTTNLTLGFSGNCISQDDTTTSAKICPLKCLSTLHDLEAPLELDGEETTELPTNITLSLFVRNIVVYIAGFVGRAIARKSTCSTCVLALISNDKEPVWNEERVLINSKDNGGLFLPSADLVEVCRKTEHEIRRLTLDGLSGVGSAKVVNRVLRQCNEPTVFAELRNEITEDHPRWSDHVMKLVGSISQEYVKIRFHHLAREATLSVCPTTNRSKCTKAVHFTGN
jgi:hypothetical protein